MTRVNEKQYQVDVSIWVDAESEEAAMNVVTEVLTTCPQQQVSDFEIKDVNE